MKAKWFSTLLIVMMLVVAIVPAVGAAPRAAEDVPIDLGANTDNPSHPLGDKQIAQRAKGFEAKVNGKTNGPVAEVARGQFVELAREGEDSIWTVIADFGPADHPAPILFSGVPGPVHNQIPAPNRSVDNTTIWTSDFSEAYYENLLF